MRRRRQVLMVAQEPPPTTHLPEKVLPQFSFSELPTDVVSHVLPFLNTTEVAACRQVSRRLCHVASCQGVWRARLRSDFQVFHDDGGAPMALYAALATSTRAAAHMRCVQHKAAGERTRRKELENLRREHWVLLPMPFECLLSRSKDDAIMIALVCRVILAFAALALLWWSPLLRHILFSYATSFVVTWGYCALHNVPLCAFVVACVIAVVGPFAPPLPPAWRFLHVQDRRRWISASIVSLVALIAWARWWHMPPIIALCCFLFRVLNPFLRFAGYAAIFFGLGRPGARQWNLVVLSGDIFLAACVEFVLYRYGLWFSHAILGDALRLLFRMIPLLVSAVAFVMLCIEWFVTNTRRTNSVVIFMFFVPLAVVGGFEVIVWWAGKYATMYAHGWLACVRAFTHVLNALAGIASGTAYPCLLWWLLWLIPHPQRGNRDFGIGMWVAAVLVSLLSLVAALLSHYSGANTVALILESEFWMW